MNNPNPPRALVQAAPKDAVEFTPFGSEDKIKLSLSIVRNFVAEPTKRGDLPDDRDCMRFMMLCRSRRLNPFEGDAFLIGFYDRDTDATKWSLITAHQTFTKRAEQHPEFNGKRSGVIVWPPIPCRPCGATGRIEVSGKDIDVGPANKAMGVNKLSVICPACEGRGFIDEIEGDFVPDTDDEGNQIKLVGGWCKVYYKTRAIPEHQRLKLATYNKNFGVWRSDPAGMICKCAEAAALRSAFPTVLGGLFLREEFRSQGDESVQISGPEFPTQLPTAKAPQLEAPAEAEPEPEPKAAPKAPVTPKAPAPKPLVKAKSAPTGIAKLRSLLVQADISEGELIDFMGATGMVDAEVTSLEEMELTQPNVMELTIAQWDEMRAKLLKARPK